MTEVNVSELRQHLPAFLRRVQAGEELAITSHGRVVARLVPDRDRQAAAKARLALLREKAVVHDVESPLGEAWDVLSDSP